MPRTYEPIATATVASTGGTVTFSSIPNTYTDLVIVSSALRGVTGSGGDSIRAQFNSDTGSNYSRTGLYGNGTSALSFRQSSQTELGVGSAGDYSGTPWSPSIASIMNYSNTTTFKTVIMRGNEPTGIAGAQVALWRSTAAISSIYLFCTNGFYVGSTFTLYGIKAA